MPRSPQDNHDVGNNDMRREEIAFPPMDAIVRLRTSSTDRGPPDEETNASAESTPSWLIYASADPWLLQQSLLTGVKKYMRKSPSDDDVKENEYDWIVSRPTMWTQLFRVMESEMNFIHLLVRYVHDFRQKSICFERGDLRVHKALPVDLHRKVFEYLELAEICTLLLVRDFAPAAKEALELPRAVQLTSVGEIQLAKIFRTCSRVIRLSHSSRRAPLMSTKFVDEFRNDELDRLGCSRLLPDESPRPADGEHTIAAKLFLKHIKSFTHFESLKLDFTKCKKLGSRSKELPLFSATRTLTIEFKKRFPLRVLRAFPNLERLTLRSVDSNLHDANEKHREFFELLAISLPKGLRSIHICTNEDGKNLFLGATHSYCSTLEERPCEVHLTLHLESTSVAMQPTQDSHFDVYQSQLASFRVRGYCDPHEVSFHQLCALLPASLLQRIPSLTMASRELPASRVDPHPWLVLRNVPSPATAADHCYFRGLRVVHFDHVHFTKSFLDALPSLFPSLQAVHITNPKYVVQHMETDVAEAFAKTSARYFRLTFNSIEVVCQPWVEAFARHCHRAFLDFTVDPPQCVLRELVEAMLSRSVRKWLIHFVSVTQSQSCWLAGSLQPDGEHVRRLGACENSHFVRHFQEAINQSQEH